MKFEDAGKYRKQIKKLYKSAFPRNERAPFFLLMRRTGNGRDSFNAVIKNGEFIGLVYTISTEKLVYIFFLALTEDKRGKGYGSEILERIQNTNQNKAIMLLVEDTDDTGADNYEERIKRLNFYISNGFKRLNIKVNEAGVDYEILGTKDSVSSADFFGIMRDWVGGVLFKFLYKKNDLSEFNKKER